MTLADLATFICTKVNQTEAEDIAACKSFLQQRFKMLWKDQLWKDSLVMYTQTIDPTAPYAIGNTYLPTKGILLAPPIIERIIAVRSDSRHLNVQRPEFYFRVDLDVFAKQGQVTDFMPLPGCVWEFDAPEEILLVRGAQADAASPVTLDLLGSDGATVNRSKVLLGNALTSAGTSDRIDRVLKQATNGNVSVEGSTGILVVNARADQGQATLILGPGPDLVNFDQNYLLNVGQSVLVKPDYWIGQQLAIPAVIPGGTSFRGTITVLDAITYTFVASPTPAVAVLQPGDTAAPIRQRIRLLQIPQTPPNGQQPFTIRVLGKRTAPSFTDDLDQPGLTGVENCLIAFAQADMLQRERHYAKANQVQQEGLQLLQQLKAEEVVQQAHEQRILPEAGYAVDEWNRLYGFNF